MTVPSAKELLAGLFETIDACRWDRLRPTGRGPLRGQVRDPPRKDRPPDELPARPGELTRHGPGRAPHAPSQTSTGRSAGSAPAASLQETGNENCERIAENDRREV